jgi:hypothetical protein
MAPELRQHLQKPYADREKGLSEWTVSDGQKLDIWGCGILLGNIFLGVPGHCDVANGSFMSLTALPFDIFDLQCCSPDLAHLCEACLVVNPKNRTLTIQQLTRDWAIAKARLLHGCQSRFCSEHLAAGTGRAEFVK